MSAVLTTQGFQICEENPSLQAPEITFSPPCASQVRGTAIVSTLQIQLAQKKTQAL